MLERSARTVSEQDGGDRKSEDVFHIASSRETDCLNGGEGAVDGYATTNREAEAPTRFIGASSDRTRRCGVAHTAPYRNRNRGAGSGTGRFPPSRGTWDYPDGELRLPWPLRGRFELQTKPATAIPTTFTHLHRL